MGKVPYRLRMTFNANGTYPVKAPLGIIAQARLILGTATKWKATLTDSNGLDVLNGVASDSDVSANATYTFNDIGGTVIGEENLTLTVTNYTGTDTTPGEVILDVMVN